MPSRPPNVPNSYPCYKDSDCSSKRCNRWWKCQAKAKLGEFCRYAIVNGIERNKSECENGLSCSVKLKCYHLPRHENEPCNQDFANCVEGLSCDDKKDSFDTHKCRKVVGHGEKCGRKHEHKQCEDGLICDNMYSDWVCEHEIGKLK